MGKESWITKYVDEKRQTKTAPRLSDMERALTRGIVYVGEEHTDTAARAAIADLIRAGKVRHLVVELNSDFQPLLDQCTADAATKTDLQSFKTVVRGSSEGDPNAALARMQKLVSKSPSTGATTPPPSYKALVEKLEAEVLNANHIKTSMLLYIAVKYKCRVYCADLYTSKPTMPSNMELRNVSVFKCINDNKLREKQQEGVIVLFGASHFGSDKTTINTLSQAPLNNIFMFSRSTNVKDGNWYKDTLKATTES